MFLGLPVFAFDCVYNRLTTENRAVYWDTAASLAALVGSLDASRLDGLGAGLKEIAGRRYRWGIISRKYEALYAAITRGGQGRPLDRQRAGLVHLDP